MTARRALAKGFAKPVGGTQRRGRPTDNGCMWSFLPVTSLAFIAGVACATGAADGSLSLAAAAPVAWLAVAAAAATARRPPVAALAFAAAAFAGGVWTVTAAPGPPPPPPVPDHRPLDRILRVETARPHPDGITVVARIERTRAPDGTWLADGRRVRVPVPHATWLPVRGDRVHVAGPLAGPGSALHPYAFDPAAFARSRGVAGTIEPVTELALIQSGRGLGARIDRLRVRVERSLITHTDRFAAGSLPGAERAQGVLVAITTGSRGLLDPTLRAQFADNGAAHVLAVSGLHLGLLTAGAFGLLGGIARLLTPLTQRTPARRIAALTAMPLVFAYVAFTGAPASAVRAGIMANAVLLAIAFGRRPSGIHAVMAAAAVMLAVRHTWIADIGYQLSVTATASLVATARLAVSRWWLESLRVSMVASIATAPVLLWHFGRAPVMSPLTNLAVVPPIALVALPAGLVAGLLDAAHLPGASPLAWLATAATLVALTLADRASTLLEISVCYGRPGALSLVILTVGAVLSPWFGRVSIRAHLVVGGALLVTLFALRPASHDGRMVMHAIPVGQGDATLVQMPDGSRYLIDAGGNPFSSRSTADTAVLPYLHGIGIARVDVVVMSHPDFDHAGGLPGAIEALRPAEVWLPTGHRRTVTTRVETAAESVGATVRRFQLPYVRGDPNGRVEVAPAAPGMDANNGGLVLRTCARDVCFLLPGDIEHEREAAMVASEIPLRADVLKVPHHGSLTSSTPAFLDAVGARVAVFHLGEDNRFNFPRADVVERYDARNVRSYRTDAGPVRVWTDGTRIEVEGRWAATSR